MCIRRAIDVINNWLQTDAIYAIDAFTYAISYDTTMDITMHLYSLQSRNIFPFQFEISLHPLTQAHISTRSHSQRRYANVIMQSKSIAISICRMFGERFGRHWTETNEVKWNDEKSCKKMLSKPYE